MTAITASADSFARETASHAPARSWISRALARLVESRRLSAEREVARFIMSQGGRLTDDLERKIASTAL